MAKKKKRKLKTKPNLPKITFDFKKIRLDFKKIKKLPQYKLYILAVFSLVTILALCLGIYSLICCHKVYGKASIGSIDFSGKKTAQIDEILKSQSEKFSNSTINLKYVGDEEVMKNYQISPAQIGLNYNLEATKDRIWFYGRSRNFFVSFWQQLASLFIARKMEAVFTIDESALKSKISIIADEVDNPEKDYLLVYNNGQFILDDQRQEGERINQTAIINNINKRIGTFNADEMAFSAEKFIPQVDANKARACLEKANKILSFGDLILEYNSQQFKLETDDMGAIIKSKTSGDNLEIVFDDNRLDIFIDSLVAAIDSEPSSTTLKIVNGKAVVDKSSKLGTTLDQAQTKSDLISALASRMIDDSAKVTSKVMLKVDIKEPEIDDAEVTSLGIIELVGTGTTSFTGSPANRVHNIQVGAAAISGALVKPGETFSTLGRLGKIDASSGYLEELVIKDNRTTPEFGGGLCQVSSTLFRAALNAGLNIVERQNHKYRVSYYEPPVGMDATIYDPAPDFKFQNNFGSFIYIQSKIAGTKITFEIYGTKDSRVVEISAPVLGDIVDPGAPVYVETDTLAPGEKKQIEKAHQGATARFDYKVSKDGQVIQQTTFVSKYVPWPERWLVGKGTPPTPTSSCTDGQQNGDEMGVDCGGSCPTACPV